MSLALSDSQTLGQFSAHNLGCLAVFPQTPFEKLKLVLEYQRNLFRTPSDALRLC